MEEKPTKPHNESHSINRIRWIRAAILGANDGILSTASILSGMVAGNASQENIMLAGLAALVAGATSMATGEYVSVSSQLDIEKADLAREEQELINDPVHEHEELAQIYVLRGLTLDLAREVATQLMDKDALGAHAHDELGIDENNRSKPLQAALTSAASFTFGALLPLVIAIFSPPALMFWSLIISSLASLALLGALGAKVGRVALRGPTMRVLLWGALSLALTSSIGGIFKLTL